MQGFPAKPTGRNTTGSPRPGSHPPAARARGIVAGKLNKQIADELATSERTIKTQRAQLMSKLGVDSAAELGRLAMWQASRQPAT